MKRWSGMLFVLLILGACNGATGNSYGSGSGGGNNGGFTNTTPPWHVTYKNTTVNTTGSPPTDGMTYDDGATVTVLGNTGHLSWPPFTWVAWNTEDNGGELGGGGGTDYAPGAAFVIHSNVILYGRWVD